MPEISKEVCNFAQEREQRPGLCSVRPGGPVPPLLESRLEVLSVKPEAQIGAASPSQRAFANESQKPDRACVVGMVDLHRWP